VCGSLLEFEDLPPNFNMDCYVENKVETYMWKSVWKRWNLYGKGGTYVEKVEMYGSCEEYVWKVVGRVWNNVENLIYIFALHHCLFL